MTTEFSGKVVLITGTGGGQGRAAALRFGGAGALVAWLMAGKNVTLSKQNLLVMAATLRSSVEWMAGCGGVR